MVLWSWQAPTLRVHFLTNLAIIAGAALVRWGKQRALFIRCTAVLAIVQVGVDFVALVLPSMSWPLLAARETGTILMLDVACMVFATAVLYAQQSQLALREDICMLRESRYRFAPA